MPVPTVITELDTNEANNSPAGGESAKGNIDNYLRALGAFIRQVYDSLQTNVTAVSASASAAKIPVGTMLTFPQAAAPTGWTKDTTHNNKALRIVSGTGGASGGTVDFTTAFMSKSVSGVVGNTTLATSQIPNHNHPGGEYTGSNSLNPGASIFAVRQVVEGQSNTGGAGGGGAHNHSFTGTAIDLAVKYVDAILATRDAYAA